MPNRRDLLKLLPATLALPALSRPALAQPGTDRLRAIMREAVPNIEPYSNSQRSGLVVAHHVWDTLIHRDPVSFEHQPLLATEWKWVDDVTLELKLRRGVTFHNGDAFTADDVIFTINTVTAPDARVAVPGNVSWMKGAEKIDDFTVRILTKNPFPAALDYLALTVPMLPKAYRERVGADGYARAPIGCGPYKVTRLEPGALVEMERHEGYYAGSPKGKPQIRRLSLRFVPDSATEMTELLSGQADWIWKVGIDQIPNLARMPMLKTLSSATMRINYLSIDAAGRSGAENPLTKQPVRQAIFHAIDRQTMAKQMAGADSIVPPAPCYPAQFGCDADAAVKYDYDPAKARALLAEAGFANGFDIEMVAYLEPNIGAALQAYLGAVGIRARISQLQVAAAIQRAWRGEAPLYLGSWGSYSIGDVSAILPVMFGGGNDDYARDAELAKLIREGGLTQDAAARKAAYSAAIRRATEQAYWLPLHNQVVNYAFSKQLDFTAHPDELPRFYMARWA
ncbi:MAG TPA: ABC transporter substrate-binding protein [Roseomonas sp.]|nr:ABC transporter substrate-binding protein [Roseomonas sp.]